MGSDAIDWSAAQRIGELIAGSGGRARDWGVRSEAIEPLARDFAERVSDYTGLALARELPPLEVVDRPAWIAANLKTMRPLLDPLTARMGGGGDGITGMVSGPLRAASGLLLGAQVGALTGVLSQRVLGQYDLALLDAEVRPRLLLLAPNLAQAARNLGVDRDELVLWVSDPRDHPCRPVRGDAMAARAPRRDAERADRRPAGEARPPFLARGPSWERQRVGGYRNGTD